MPPKTAPIALASLFLLIASAAIISFSGAQTSPTPTPACSVNYAVSPPCAKPACTQTSPDRWHCVCSSGYIYKTFAYGTEADLGIDYDKAVCVPATSPISPSPTPSSCPAPTPLPTSCTILPTRSSCESTTLITKWKYSVSGANLYIDGAVCCTVPSCTTIPATLDSNCPTGYARPPEGTIAYRNYVDGINDKFVCCPSQTALEPVAQAPTTDTCPIKPDLIVDAIDITDITTPTTTYKVTSSSEVGKKVRVDYYIKNIGTKYADLQIYPDLTSAFQNIKVFVKIIRDGIVVSQLDAELPSIITSSGSTKLESGQSVSVFPPLDYEFLSAGNYCFEIKADSTALVEELNEANNIKSVCLKVYEKGAGKSDLTITDIAFRDPSNDQFIYTSAVGKRINLAYTVKNIGEFDAKTASLKTRIQLKKDGLPLSIQDGQHANFILSPGQVQKYTSGITLFSEGYYCEDVTVDFDDHILEANELNNKASKCLTVTPDTRPDLILESIVFIDPVTDQKITSVEAGRKVKLEYVITNNGKTSANIPTLTNKISMWGSTGNIIEIPDYSLASPNPLLPGLNHGPGSVELEFKTSGRHCTELEIDSTKSVDEFDESNNIIKGPCITVKPALIAHWKLDEMGGDYIVDSATIYDGKLFYYVLYSADASGTSELYPKRIRGKFGKALKFGGLQDYAETPLEVKLVDPNDFSVSLWAKIPEFSVVEKKIMQIKGGPKGSVDRDSVSIAFGEKYLSLYWKRLDGVIDSISYFADNSILNQWLHIVGVWKHDGENLNVIFYINGQKVAEKISPLLAASSSYVIIGSSSSDNQPFKDYVDDVRIYDGALSDKQVAELYVPAKSCTKNADCETYEKCSAKINQCVEANTCVKLIDNGPSKDKIDVLFLADGTGFEGKEEEFRNLVREHVNTLFSVEPLFSNKQKFNVWTYSPGEDIDIDSTSIISIIKADITVKELTSQCGKIDNIAVLSNKNFKSFSKTILGTSFTSLSKPNSKGRLMHVLGHALFRLGDEYLHSEILSRTFYRPNCVSSIEEAVGLWGDLVNKNEKGELVPEKDRWFAKDLSEATLWLGNLAGLGVDKKISTLSDGRVVVLINTGQVAILDNGRIGFYRGCTTLESNFRSTRNSVMNDPEFDLEYHEVNARLMLNEILNKYP